MYLLLLIEAFGIRPGAFFAESQFSVGARR
jgi:hypothetical protein